MNQYHKLEIENSRIEWCIRSFFFLIAIVMMVGAFAVTGEWGHVVGALFFSFFIGIVWLIWECAHSPNIPVETVNAGVKVFKTLNILILILLCVFVAMIATETQSIGEFVRLAFSGFRG